MPVFVSPGAYTVEEDFSLYVPQIATSICAMVGWTPKGRTDIPLFITNAQQLIDKMGKPDLNSLMSFSALNFLDFGNKLWVKRVVGPDATKANATITDGNATTPTNVLQITAVGEGAYYNDVAVQIQATDPLIASSANRFDLIVKERGEVVEFFKDLTTDPNGGDKFAENIKSELVQVTVLDTTKVPASGTYQLQGGNDDLANLSSAEVIAGLQTFLSEDYDINILCAPGWSDASVINEGLSICEQRADCMYIADPPIGLTPQEVVDWHNGAGAWAGQHQAFNSSYGALYWSWLKIYDPYNAREVWVPPSGFIAGVYAYTDTVAYPWFAPAGYIRGKLVRPLGVEYSPTLGERDLLYGTPNAVNPIVNFRGDGIVVWGQRTLQRKPSATDRVNVRRLLLYARKAIALSTKYMTFEPNDPITWKRWVNLVQPFFDDIKSKRGVYDFRVVCDETTNTPQTIDRNEMHGYILLKPTKTAEVIVNHFRILSTGASFEEI